MIIHMSADDFQSWVAENIEGPNPNWYSVRSNALAAAQFIESKVSRLSSLDYDTVNNGTQLLVGLAGLAGRQAARIKTLQGRLAELEAQLQAQQQ